MPSMEGELHEHRPRPEHHVPARLGVAARPPHPGLVPRRQARNLGALGPAVRSPQGRLVRPPSVRPVRGHRRFRAGADRPADRPPPRTLRPPVGVRPQGPVPLLEGRPLRPGSPDGPLPPDRRTVLRVPRDALRQLRPVELGPPAVELRQRGTAHRHRRPLGRRRPLCRPALRREHARGVMDLAVARRRVRARHGRPPRRRPVRRAPHRRRRGRFLVAGARPARPLRPPSPARREARRGVRRRLLRPLERRRVPPRRRPRLPRRLPPALRRGQRVPGRPAQPPRPGIPRRLLRPAARGHRLRQDDPRRGPRRRAAGRRTRPARRPRPAPVAVRHQHRRLVLLRRRALQDRPGDRAPAGRHRGEERLPAAQRPPAPGRHHRRADRRRPRLPRGLDLTVRRGRLRQPPLEGPRRGSDRRDRRPRAGEDPQLHPRDIRFTTGQGDRPALYAFLMAWPDDRTVRIESLGTARGLVTAPPRRISLLGTDAPVRWTSGHDALDVRLPPGRPPPPTRRSCASNWTEEFRPCSIRRQ